MAKSRWEIENQGFDDTQNRYGFDHLFRHNPNGLLITWLPIGLMLTLERLHGTPDLYQGNHRVLEPVALVRLLLVNLAQAADSS